MSEFTFIDAFEIKDAEADLKATVCFASDDFSKPLSVHLSDRGYGVSVQVPFDLWERFVAGVSKAADQ